MTIIVKAERDPEAGVWYVIDSDLPGLHVEGETLDEIYAKLTGGILDLTGDADFQLIAEGHRAAAADYEVTVAAHR